MSVRRRQTIARIWRWRRWMRILISGLEVVAAFIPGRYGAGAAVGLTVLATYLTVRASLLHELRGYVQRRSDGAYVVRSTGFEPVTPAV